MGQTGHNSAFSFDFKLGRLGIRADGAQWPVITHCPKLGLSYELRADGRWTLEVARLWDPALAIYLDGTEITGTTCWGWGRKRSTASSRPGNCTDAPREM